LFYRISAISVHLPPLRERREDILPLANAFLKRLVRPGGPRHQLALRRRRRKPAKAIRLAGQRAPIAERNPAGRPHVRRHGAGRARSLHRRQASAPENSPDLTLMEAMERNTIMQMLKETGGNKLETAKRLGIGRQTLYNKIKIYGIEP
jgi:DNA-binding NtrC family response regulator